MDNKTILMVVVAIVLGMLVANMFKDVCGCKVVEGQHRLDGYVECDSSGQGDCTWLSDSYGTGLSNNGCGGLALDQSNPCVSGYVGGVILLDRTTHSSGTNFGGTNSTWRSSVCCGQAEASAPDAGTISFDDTGCLVVSGGGGGSTEVPCGGISLDGDGIIITPSDTAICSHPVWSGDGKNYYRFNRSNWDPPPVTYTQNSASSPCSSRQDQCALDCDDGGASDPSNIGNFCSQCCVEGPDH